MEDVPFYEKDSEQYIEENYLDFEKGTSKEDIWHWFDERHSQGIHFLLYEYGGKEAEKIYYTKIDERIPEEKRDKDLFYYECRTCEEETTIEKKVTVDFSGTFITDKDILKDKEYIELKELFNNKDIEMEKLEDEEEEYEEDNVEEIITSISDLDNEGHFTVARVMENGKCVELHYDEGEASIEYGERVARDRWENETSDIVDWFNLDLTDDEILKQ